MQELLATKLYMPPPPAGLVPRPRLVELLQRGLQARLVLVCAPAGFGKTTLLAQWLAELDLPVAWLSLDAGDNDPARFLVYLGAALERVVGAAQGTAQTVRAAGGGGLTQPAELDSLLTGLLNRAASLPCDFLLVLDDLHLVERQNIYEILGYLLEHQPPNMHMVISTRADPLLPLSRLRSRFQLVELRAEDLRFTPQEAAQFLEQVIGIELTLEQITALLQRTEGWAAGLQLAGLSMQRRTDLSKFIAAFTGSHEYIADFLNEEVLSQQPPGVQRFMLQTSILGELSAPLCDAVTGEGEGAEMLEWLKERNLFIVSLDDRREWYKYHVLFADLLQQRLRRAHPGEQVQELHRRAAAWYRQNGRIPQAIRHALAAGDALQAAEMIESVAEATLGRSEVLTFLDWVEQLPRELLAERPELSVYTGWAQLLGGYPGELVQLSLQEARLGADHLPARVLPLYAFLAVVQGREAEAYALSESALQRLPPEEAYLRSIAVWTHALAQLRDMDTDAADELMRQTAEQAQASGNRMMAVMTLSNQAEFALSVGDLNRAFALYQHSLEVGTDAQGRQLPITSESYFGMGKVCREWNMLEQAEEYLLKGIELSRQWGEMPGQDGYMNLALVQQARGREGDATASVREAISRARRSLATDLDDWMGDMLQARLLMYQGRLEQAHIWMEERNIGRHTLVEAQEERDIGSRTLKYEQILVSRLALLEGHAQTALVLLQPVLEIIRQRGRVQVEIEVLGLMALAHQVLGDISQAQDCLGQALDLAQPGGHVRTFLDFGAPLVALLKHAARQGGSRAEYASRLLEAFSQEQAQGEPGSVLPPASPAAGIVEMLTERELEVLRLIASGHTNQQIARILVIAPSTVKTHTRNIYGKLDVSNRTQAAARAHGLGLL